MKTKTKILKVFAIFAIFLGNSHLMAQTSNLPTQTVCVGDIEPYTLVDPVNGPPAASSTYQWSTTGGIIVGGISTGDNIDIDWTTVGVYTVTVVATDNITGCEDSPIDVVVTVEDLANPPVAFSPAPICLGDPNPQMTAATGGGTGNNVFNWYADAALTTPLVSNAATYTDPIPYPAPATYSYWVTEESANGCEGLATQVDVVVTPLPLAPSLTGLPYEACFGLANPLFTASGSATNFNWYDAGGVILPLGTNTNTFTSTESIPSVYTYFVEEKVGSCTSQQTSFTFTIHPSPAPPSINPLQITICEGDISGDFTAVGAGTFTWYSDAGLTTVISGATTCTPTQVLPGSYIYYLTETDPTTTCISVSSQATFTIDELPLAPTITAAPSAIICLGDAPPIFTATTGGGVGNGVFNWYDDDPVLNPAAILLLANSATYTPAQTAVGLYPLYVTESNSLTNCEGLAFQVTFQIIDLPIAPLCTDEEICLGDPLPTFTPSTGTNLIWYNDAVLILANQVGVGPTYIAGANQTPPPSAVGTYSYWVVDQPAACISPPLQVDLIINPLPTPGPIWHN